MFDIVVFYQIFSVSRIIFWELGFQDPPLLSSLVTAQRSAITKSNLIFSRIALPYGIAVSSADEKTFPHTYYHIKKNSRDPKQSDRHMSLFGEK